MKTLRPLTPEQMARAEDRLLHPARGSRIEAARNHGIDLTLLVEQLRLTPAERAGKLEEASMVMERVRGAARRRS
ncbi:MAG TPA: hypothetical protein VNV82_00525 [Bryobacteraceae bacterium]|jgi:hypothetical protein|nr:hypothetical protein [Bryobacteraceae bacterium]